MFLEIERVQGHYGPTQVLRDIGLGIAGVEMHVMLGPSGCGKTTLLRSIAGLQSISGTRIDDKAPAARGFAMVFQHYALFPNMMVRGNLAFALSGGDQPCADRRPRGPDAANRRSDRPRVALARALVVEPKLLLLDQPLSALDAQIRKRLQLELKRMQRQTGLTAILVTHDQDEAMRMGDRITVLNAGRIAQTDLAANVFHRPADLFVAKFMGEENILPANMLVTGANGFAVIHPTGLELHPTYGPSFHAQVVRLNCRLAAHEVKVDVIYDPSARLPTASRTVTVRAPRRNIHLLDGE